MGVGVVVVNVGARVEGWKVGEIFIYSRKIFRIHVIECAGRWGYNDDRVYVFTEFTI